MDQDQPDWNLLRAFQATAQEGSLSAAARRLGLTQPTLSRQIAALEGRLSLMLFERNGRYLHLTDAGRELLPHVQDMGEAAHRLSLSASGQQSDLAGLVRITASEVASAYMLPPILRSLRLRAPQIIAEVVAGDDIRNLMTREADIALRHVRPEQPNLIARLLSERKGYFYATTGYLDKRGRPGDLAALAAAAERDPRRGEIVILVDRAASSVVNESDLDLDLEAALRTHTVRDAAEIVARAHGLPKRTVYQKALALGKK